VIHDFLGHGFEEVEFRGRQMTIEQAIGLDEGNRGQSFVVNGSEEIRGVLDAQRIEAVDAGIGVGKTMVCGKPDAAPLVRRNSSVASRDGSMASSTFVGVPAGMTVFVGAKFNVGCGRME